MSLFLLLPPHRVILSLTDIAHSMNMYTCIYKYIWRHYEIRGEIKSHSLSLRFILFYHLVAIFIKEFYLYEKNKSFFSTAVAAVVVAILQFSNFLKALKRGLFIFQRIYITFFVWRYFGTAEKLLLFHIHSFL